MIKTLISKIKAVPALVACYGAYFIAFFASISNLWCYVIIGLISAVFGGFLITKGRRYKEKNNIISGVFLVGSPLIIFILFVIYGIIMIAIAYPS